MTTLAITAVALAAGTWFGIRWSEETRRIDDLTTYLVSIPADEWKQ